ncbi:hypothetical protein JCM11251_001598 [Rhodosporidiobolus azoricus]
MFAGHYPHQHSSLDNLFCPSYAAPSPSPAYHSYTTPSSSMHDLERLAYLATLQQQQQRREEEERHYHLRQQAELAAYLQAQRQQQQQAAFERAVQEEVERRLQAEKAAALREALIRRAQLVQAEENRRRQQLALAVARRRQASLAAAAAQEEQQRRRRLAFAVEEEQRRRVENARRRQPASDHAANTFLKFLFALNEPADSPEPTKEEGASTPAAPVKSADQPKAVEPTPVTAPAPAPFSESSVDFSQLDEAATVLQRHFRRHAARRTALSALERLTADFESHQSSFTAPTSFTFQPSSAPTPSPSGPATPPLAYGSANSSFLTYEHYLTSLLSKIDEVQSGGDKVVKQERKELVKRVEAELVRLDGMKDEAWEKQSQTSEAPAAVVEEKKTEEDVPVQAEVAEAPFPSTDGSASAASVVASTPTPTDTRASALVTAAVTASSANEPIPSTTEAAATTSAAATSSAPLLAPAPLTATSLASLSTDTDDHLPPAPVSPPSRPHSRGSTRSNSSVASEQLNRYVAETLDRARKLGEEVERLEAEEEKEGEKEKEEKQAAPVAEKVDGTANFERNGMPEQEEGVEEIDVAAVLRRTKELAEAGKPANEASPAFEIDQSHSKALSQGTANTQEDDEKSEAGTEDFEGSTGMFAPDTPSRVLRQIERLNQQSLPDLPDLPSELPSFSEDGNSTVAHSPPARKPAILSPPLSPAARENIPPPTPYSSTPAPAHYQRSPSTIGPGTSASARSGYDTTATIGPGGRFSSVRRGGRTPTQARNGTLTEKDETSYERSVSEIVKAKSLEESREDMLVLSGGSGTEDNAVESFQGRPAASVELSALPAPQIETEDETGDETEEVTSEHSNTDADTSAPRPHPLDALGALDIGSPPHLTERVCSDSSVRGKKMSDRFLQRSPSPRNAPSPPNNVLPASLSPLRPRGDSSVASVEIGRHTSPQNSPHAQQSYSREATPSRFSTQSPSALTPVGVRTPKFDSPLASLDLNLNPTTPAANLDAAERRKAHLLGTLRSTAKHALTRGAPHPLRSGRKTSPRPEAADDEPDRTSSSFGSDRSSNDLTTFHKANTSLPSGGSAEVGGAVGGARSSRFNGAKLNAYLHSLNTHLTEENQSLAKAVSRVTKDYERIESENRRLNDTIREMSVVGGGVTLDMSRARSRTTSIDGEEEGERSRLDLLGDELEGLVQGQRRIRGLQDELGSDGEERVRELEATAAELRRQAAEKDEEIRRLRDRFAGSADSDGEDGPGSQQARIDELMAELEQKDSEVEDVKRKMEEQETDFAEKMKELEDELCKVMEEQEAKVDRAREELEARRREDEALRVEEREKIARLEMERGELERQLLEDGTDVAQEIEEKVHSLRDEVTRLEETVKTLRADVSTRDKALEKMQEDLEEAERRAEEVGRRDDNSGDLDDLRRQLADKDVEMQQLDEAFEDSAQQLVQHEETIELLQKQLDAEQKKSSSLTSQLSQLSLPKTKSPLANEVYNAAKDEVIVSLEEELEESRRSADELREQLAAATRASREVELKEMEIKKLKEAKADLEGRVSSLREQSVLFSPNRTPDKSWMLRPLPSIYVPKTPGQVFGNLSAFLANDSANTSVAPNESHLADLHQMVEDLRAQISHAYEQVDDKIGRLDSAGLSNLSLARQLSDAEVRIAQLEEQLENLLGQGGSLERVKARLARVHCPECQSSFDANKHVQLLVDRHGVSLAGSTPQRPQGDSLRSTLAAANAKLQELRAENELLRNRAARSDELSSEKTQLAAGLESLRNDLKHARDEIAVLETDLRSERSRVRTLSSEYAQTSKAKAAVDSVRIPLIILLPLLLTLVSLQDLTAQLATVKALRDERAEILEGVAGLQAELKRFHEDATRHGADVAAAKRYGEDLRKVREELLLAKGKVQLLEKQVDEHVCAVFVFPFSLSRPRLIHSSPSSGTDPQALAELQQQHKLEVRGAMKRILQLKREVSREFFFRSTLGAQKEYLNRVVEEKQTTLDEILREVGALTGMPITSSSSSSTKPSFRSAVRAVIFLNRTRRLASQWAKEAELKKQFRERDYPAARGKPFAG